MIRYDLVCFRSGGGVRGSPYFARCRSHPPSRDGQHGTKSWSSRNHRYGVRQQLNQAANLAIPHAFQWAKCALTRDDPRPRLTRSAARGGTRSIHLNQWIIADLRSFSGTLTGGNETPGCSTLWEYLSGGMNIYMYTSQAPARRGFRVCKAEPIHDRAVYKQTLDLPCPPRIGETAGFSAREGTSKTVLGTH